MRAAHIAQKPYPRLFDFGHSEPKNYEKTDDDPSNQYMKARAKLALIEQILAPFCSRHFVRMVITGLIKTCNVTGDYSQLDEVLENHRKNMRPFYTQY